MATSQTLQLVNMINQIANNNNYKKSDEETAEIVADHIKKFWARSMKKNIAQYAIEDGSELTNAAKLALNKL